MNGTFSNDIITVQTTFVCKSMTGWLYGLSHIDAQVWTLRHMQSSSGCPLSLLVVLA